VRGCVEIDGASEARQRATEGRSRRRASWLTTASPPMTPTSLSRSARLPTLFEIVVNHGGATRDGKVIAKGRQGQSLGRQRCAEAKARHLKLSDSQRFAWIRRCGFVVSQRKCAHLSQEKFDCDSLARRFDLTRLRACSVGRLHRESRVARRRRRMRACFLPIGFDPRRGQEIKVIWRNRNLNEVTHGSVSDRNPRRHCFARAVSLASPEDRTAMSMRAR